MTTSKNTTLQIPIKGTYIKAYSGHWIWILYSPLLTGLTSCFFMSLYTQQCGLMGICVLHIDNHHGFVFYTTIEYVFESFRSYNSKGPWQSVMIAK